MPAVCSGAGEWATVTVGPSEMPVPTGRSRPPVSTLTPEPLPGYRPFAGPVVFVIMDGVGRGRRDESDGFSRANTPERDALLAEPLVTSLKAHGKAVGLPSDEDMGNSEVGHNALGAGRVFAQGAMLVNRSIARGAMFAGKAWR